jgi:hypothetical protein
MNKHILFAIAEGLSEKGKCPYDSSCLYGRGSHCAAPDHELEDRIARIKAAINSELGCIAVENTLNPSAWHCDDVIIFKFVDPADEN